MPSVILVTKYIHIFPTVKSALPMVAMLPTYTTSPLFSAVFLLYYSLLRRGLFVSLGVWGEGKRKRAGDFRIVPRAPAIFRLLFFLLGEKVPSGFLDNKGLWAFLSLVGSQNLPLVDVILYLRFIGIPSMSLCRRERLYYELCQLHTPCYHDRRA